MTLHTGSCRCGAVTFSADAEPIWRAYCHCRDCRKATGAPVTAFVGFRAEHCRFEGERRRVSRRDEVERSFCGECGSPLDYRDDRLPGEVHVYLGVMDRPDDFPPTTHAFESRRLSFLHIIDDLPRNSGFSIPR